MTTRFTHAFSTLASAQKSRRGVSLYSRFINRPIGRVLAALCFTLRMTPNQVTLVSAMITGLGLIVLVTGEPTPLRAALVALLLVFGFALDSADGQVARLTGSGSSAGEWLDHVVDSAKVVLVHSAVLVVGYRFLDIDPIWLLVPLAFQVVGVLTFFGGELERHLRAVPLPGAAVSAREPSMVRAIGLLPADYGVLAVSFVFLSWPPLFIVTYSVLFVANTVIAYLLLRKWFRALRSDANLI